MSFWHCGCTICACARNHVAFCLNLSYRILQEPFERIEAEDAHCATYGELITWVRLLLP